MSKQEVSSRTKALLLGFLTGCSRILGFFRQIVFVHYFGAGDLADIFNFAFNIPNNLRKLLAEGALSSAYIPELSSTLEKDPSRKEASKLIRTVFTFQIIVIIPLIFIMIIFANPIVGFLSEFSEIWKEEKAVELFRWLIFYLLLVGISALIMASLNAISQFVIPAITPIIFSICVITSVLIFSKRLGLYAMVIGVLVGGVFQILFQLPQFLKNGFSIKPLFAFRSSSFKKIMIRYFPVVLSSGLFMGLQTFAHYLASKMAEGSISSLMNSLVIWQLPFGIFSVSIITVLFPKMSRQAHLNDTQGLKDSIDEGLSGFFTFILPSSLFLFIIARMIVSTIYYRGAFTVENVEATSNVLKAYSIGILSVSGFQFLQRFFYSINSYLIPFMAALFVAILDVVFSILFFKKNYGAVGLAWANSIAYTGGFLMLWGSAGVKLKGIYLKKFLLTAGKVLFSILPLVIILLLFNHFLPNLWKNKSNLIRFSALFGVSIISALPVLLLYFLLKVEAFSDIITNRLKRRR